MKLLIFLILFLLTACQPSSDRVTEASTADDVEALYYSVGLGYSVWEFRLKDGSRCVLSTGNGTGIACQFKDLP